MRNSSTVTMIRESATIPAGNISNASSVLNRDSHYLDVWFSIYLILCLVGATANLVLLIAVLKDKKSAIATRILIANLTIGAVALSAAFFPGVAIAILLRPHILAQPAAYCTIYSATLFTVQAGTCWAEVCIAVNRLVAICFPHHYNNHWKSKRSSFGLIACAWLISLSIGVLNGTGTGTRIISLSDGNCGMRAQNDFGQFVIFSVNVVPYAISAVCSIIIFATVWRKARSSKVTPRSAKQEKLMQRRLVVARAITVSVIWCLICTIPMFTMTTRFPHLIAKNPSLARWLKILYVSEYAVNPVVFLAMSSSYRTALQLPCRPLSTVTTHASHSRHLSYVSRPSFRRRGETKASTSTD